MNISFVDESGISPESKFFIFCVTTIDEKICNQLKMELSELKNKNGIPPNVEIKWNLNDFNRQLELNSLPRFSSESHKQIKNEVLELICSCDKESISIMWYLSPKMFFRRDPWRSYKYAMSDVFGVLANELSENNSQTIALVDEFGNLGVRRENRKKLLEDFILTMHSDRGYDPIVLIVPNMDSTVSFGHQLNDIGAGLINSYLTQLHSGHHSGISGDVVSAIDKLKPFVAKKITDKGHYAFGVRIIIKPEIIKYREDLQLLINTTHASLRKDFGFY